MLKINSNNIFYFNGEDLSVGDGMGINSDFNESYESGNLSTSEATDFLDAYGIPHGDMESIEVDRAGWSGRGDVQCYTVTDADGTRYIISVGSDGEAQVEVYPKAGGQATYNIYDDGEDGYKVKVDDGTMLPSEAVDVFYDNKGHKCVERTEKDLSTGDSYKYLSIDNGDGTVTVQVYKRNPNAIPGASDEYVLLGVRRFDGNLNDEDAQAKIDEDAAGFMAEANAWYQNDVNDIQLKSLDELLECYDTILTKQEEIFEAAKLVNKISVNAEGCDKGFSDSFKTLLSDLDSKTKCFGDYCTIFNGPSPVLSNLATSVKATIIELYKAECIANGFELTEEDLSKIVDEIFSPENRAHVHDNIGDDFGSGILWDAALATIVQGRDYYTGLMTEDVSGLCGTVVKTLVNTAVAFVSSVAETGAGRTDVNGVWKETLKAAVKTVLGYYSKKLAEGLDKKIIGTASSKADELIEDLMKKTGASTQEQLGQQIFNLSENAVKYAWQTAAGIGITTGFDTVLAIATNALTALLLTGKVTFNDLKPGSTFLKTTVKDICATAGGLFFGKPGRAVGTIIGTVLGNLAIKPFTDEFGVVEEGWCAAAGAATLAGGCAGAAVAVISFSTLPGVGAALLIGAAIGYGTVLLVHAGEQRDRDTINSIAWDLYANEGVPAETALKVGQLYLQYVYERCGYWTNGEDTAEMEAQCMADARRACGLEP